MTRSNFLTISKLFFIFSCFCFIITSCGEDCVDAEGDTWYEDLDGDGKGNPNSFQTACLQPTGYVSDNTDDFDLTISTTQRAIVAYFGATWCPPCGEHGGPLLDYMDANISNDDKVVLSFHVNDAVSPNNSDASDYIAEIRDITGVGTVPRIHIGGGQYYVDRGLFSNASSNQSRLNDDIANIQQQSTTVGVSGVARLEDNKVIVQTGLEFQTAANEAFYVSAYLLEDNIIADQKVGSTSSSSTEPDVNHNHVVTVNQDEASSFKGTNLGSSFTAGQVVANDFTITIPQFNNRTVNTDNLKVAIVVWRGSDVRMENGIVVDIK